MRRDWISRLAAVLVAGGVGFAGGGGAAARADTLRDGLDADVDQDGLPDHWVPLHDAEHPRLARVAFPDRAERHAGEAAIRIEPNGAGAVLRRRPSIPVSPERAYLVAGWTRAVGLSAGSASIAVVWLDAKGFVLGESVTGPLVGEHPWTRQELELERAPLRAAAALLELRVVHGDLGARVWFDDLEFLESARLEVRLGGTAQRLFPEGARPVLDLRARGLSAGDHVLSWGWSDAASDLGSRAVRVGPDGGLSASASLPLDFSGGRELRLSLTGPSGEVGARRIRLGVLPGEPGEAGEVGRIGGFVVDGPGAFSSSPDFERLARAWGAGTLLVPIQGAPLGRGKMPAATHTGRRGGLRRVGMVRAGGRSLPASRPAVTGAGAGLGRGVPTHGAAGLPGEAVTALLSALRGGWSDCLDAVACVDGGEAVPGDGLEQAAALAAAVRSVDPRLACGLAGRTGPVESVLLAEALGAGGFRSFELPAAKPVELAAAAVRGLEVQAVLRAVPASDAGAWVRLGCEAYAAGARALLVPVSEKPTGPETRVLAGPLFDALGDPTDAFHGLRLLLLAVTGSTLSDGVVLDRPGLREYVFVHPARVDVVCWREGEAGEVPLPEGEALRVFDARGRTLLRRTSGVEARGGRAALPAEAGPFLLFDVDRRALKPRLRFEPAEPRLDLIDRPSALELSLVNELPGVLEDLTVALLAGGELAEAPARAVPAGDRVGFRVWVAPGSEPTREVRVRVTGRFGDRRLETTRTIAVNARSVLEAALAIRPGGGGGAGAAAIVGVVTNRSDRRLTLRAHYAMPGGRVAEQDLGSFVPGEGRAVELPLAGVPAAGAGLRVILREVGGGAAAEVEAR
ncbi:MAG: hypothetical protein HYZ53_04480 [Planctomycetes bacterium]|nr:hypothetical protein [Planctomycetota bacterium]